MDDFLFVYGTLKQSENHLAHSLLTGDSVYYGQGYFHGKLYQVTTYPAAVLSNGTERVYGEVYRILRPTALFKRLDDYEECNNHYPEPHE
jgi:gamma-glutamylcyclotransferase (GGCT)/AIG2-like uncharacterized protein YtfP